MFNVGPLELMVLAIVGLVVLGPDRLPNLARDAARMIKSLREMATGAREQLKEGLGPEFADVDLSNLNPRTALTRAVLGDDVDLQKYDPRRFSPRAAARDVLFGTDEPANGNGSNGNGSNGNGSNGHNGNGNSRTAGDFKQVSMAKSKSAEPTQAAQHPAAATPPSESAHPAPRPAANRPRPRPRPSATPPAPPASGTPWADDAT